MSQERKVPKRYIIRTIKSIISAALQKVVENMELFTHKIRTINGYDITLVQRLLQHSSAAITQRYIGIEPQRIEEAIEGHAQLL